jgi:hypothetical protein
MACMPYLTNICHVRILAVSSERPLLTHWTLVRFPLIVGERDAKESPLARGLLHSHVCFILYKHTSVVCVDDKYNSVRWLANAKVDTLWERDQKNQAYIYSRCTRVRLLAEYTIRGKGMTVIHVAPCTVDSVGAFVKYFFIFARNSHKTQPVIYQYISRLHFCVKFIIADLRMAA